MSNFKKAFAKIITLEYPKERDKILTELEKQYNLLKPDAAFAKKSANPIDRRIEICSYFLALIMVMDKNSKSYEQIKEVCIKIAYETVRPKNKVQVFLKKLPVKLIRTPVFRFIVKKLAVKVSHKAHPEGFRAEIITDRKETFGLGYGVDILECGICKLFSKYNYSKYTAILCEVDNITSSLAGLELVRSGTIALGAEKCDFRFKIKQ